MFDATYRNARLQLTALAETLTDTQLATVLPGCPEWTVKDLYAHVAGGAADIVAGRVEGAGSPAWTGRQVEERRDRPIADVLAEWATASSGLETMIAERQVGLNIVFDLLTHEADVYEGLGLGRPSSEGWEPTLQALAKYVTRGFSGEGTLVLRFGEATYRGGDGEPEIEPLVDSYELFRGLMSRRSRAQLLAWSWSGDAARMVDQLPVFGPRQDDQPVPASK